MSVSYNRVNWADYPATTTPVNATNLNKMDKGIADLTSEINDVESDVSDLNNSLTAADNLKFRFATDGEGNYGYLDGDDAFVPFSNLENAKIWVMFAFSGYIYGGNPYTGAGEVFAGSTGTGTYTFGDLTLTWSSGGILTTNKRMLYMGRTSASDAHYITKIIEPNTPTFAAPVYQSTSMALLELEPVTPP